MSIKNFKDIKNIMYINLAHRQDRREHFEKEMQKVNLIASRFDAILNNDGEKGCLMSHIACLQKATENNYDHLLVLEDDVLFTDPKLLINQFNKFVEIHNDWDVILLGANNNDNYEEIDECSIKVRSAFSAVAYLVNGHYISKLLKNFIDSLTHNKPVDVGWNSLQRTDNWYLIIPLTVNQLECQSDILKKKVNYTDMMLKIKYNKI